MSLSRRSLLSGLLCSAAAIAAGPVAKLAPADVVYGFAFETAPLWLIDKPQLLWQMSQMLYQGNDYADDIITAKSVSGRGASFVVIEDAA